MKKIAIIEEIDKEGLKLLDSNPKFTYEIITDTSEEHLIKVLPNFDEERVYTSNIKKVLQWYNLLASKNFDFTAIQEEEEETEEA